jgi:hypothetical protein
VQVSAVKWWTAADQRAYNLTVDGLHTYYVATAGRSLLVHNCDVNLFHGTDAASAVSIMRNGVNPSHSSASLDFGRGFYTTRDLRQALDWTGNQKFNGDRLVMAFKVPQSALDDLDSMTLFRGDRALDPFVRSMRSGGSHGFEMVSGPYLSNVRPFMNSGAAAIWKGDQTAFFGSRAAGILDDGFRGIFG